MILFGDGNISIIRLVWGNPWVERKLIVSLFFYQNSNNSIPRKLKIEYVICVGRGKTGKDLALTVTRLLEVDMELVLY